MISSPRRPSKFLQQLVISLGIIFVVVVCAGGIFTYGYYRMFVIPMRRIEARQHTLLYTSDHEKLKDAMRTVWEMHGGSAAKDPDIPLNDPKAPAIINSLDAHWIVASKSGLSIELGGQGCHYGFEAIFTNEPDPDRLLRSKGEFPSKELLPGLWFYAENGIVAR